MGATISERTIEVDGIGVFLREVPGEGPPTVFVHGNPTHSADWLPFLERMDGPALAFDLPGWGRSSRPDPLAFDGSLGAHANVVERLLGELAPGRCRLSSSTPTGGRGTPAPDGRSWRSTAPPTRTCSARTEAVSASSRARRSS